MCDLTRGLDVTAGWCNLCERHFSPNNSRLGTARITLYGSHRELLARTHCPLCQFLGLWIQKHHDSGYPRAHQSTAEYALSTPAFPQNEVHVICDGWRLFKCRIPTREIADHPALRWKGYTTTDNSWISGTGSGGNGCTIDPVWIQKFLSDCCEGASSGLHHPQNGCGRDHERMDTIDLLLVDVQEHRIVKMQSSCRYIPLSYVWGHCEVVRLTKGNYAQLQQPASLDTVVLPNVIRDAMDLVRKIQERYLWVDALCIVQDDAENTEFYVDQMDLIYSSALMTIVAASTESAQDILPGVRPNSRPPRCSVRPRCP